MRMFLVGLSALWLAAHGNQTLMMNENKRIEAFISADSMNRLAVANDRITQIFGDEGTFESQHDDITGQIFLKPTAENGTKILSVTIITENGQTQDLVLKPRGKRPATVILKKSAEVADEKIPLDKGLPYVEQMMVVLKQAVSGQLPLKEGESISREAPEGYQISYKSSYQCANGSVHVFEVKNTTETDIQIDDKLFFRPGDRALAIRASLLRKGAATEMYVLSRL